MRHKKVKNIILYLVGVKLILMELDLKAGYMELLFRPILIISKTVSIIGLYFY